MTTWKLQDAKNQFSAVVREARAGYPQHVTRRGRPAVVVVATEEYERLSQHDAENAPTLAEMLLSIPQGDERFERLGAELRPIGLGGAGGLSTDDTGG